MRLFFALCPPASGARALAQWAADVQRGAGGRATREETIHLTLAFLGEADPDRALAAARGTRGRRFGLPVETARYWRPFTSYMAGMPSEAAGRVKVQSVFPVSSS